MSETATNATRDQLRAFIERVERLTYEKDELAADIRDVFAEAKATGFDVKTLRTIIKLRAMDANERAEQEALLETYLTALATEAAEERRAA